MTFIMIYLMFGAINIAGKSMAIHFLWSKEPPFKVTLKNWWKSVLFWPYETYMAACNRYNEVF